MNHALQFFTTSSHVMISLALFTEFSLRLLKFQVIFLKIPLLFISIPLFLTKKQNATIKVCNMLAYGVSLQRNKMVAIPNYHCGTLAFIIDLFIIQVMKNCLAYMAECIYLYTHTIPKVTFGWPMKHIGRKTDNGQQLCYALLP